MQTNPAPASASATKRLPAVWLVLFSAAGAFMLTLGVRQTMGLFLSPLNSATGLGIGSISLAFACGQLGWGLTQPFAGAIADKIGAGRVLFVGMLMVALGTILKPLMDTTIGLIFTIGVLAAGGAGIAGPAVLMAAASRLIPAEKRGLATGVINAGGSFGQFLLAPLAGAFILNLGWFQAMQMMGLIVLLGLPVAFLLRGDPMLHAPAGHKPLAAGAAIRAALADRHYLMLAAGFTVCGFHVAFLGTHLPGVIASCGLPLQFGAWSLAMIGLFNIIGSIGIGWAIGRWRMKSLLCFIYGARAVAILLFLIAPKTGPVMLVFAAVLGLTFLATVPPTVGLVAKFFGMGNMATLFGVIMLAHQIGGFMGAWVGGKVFEATGSYNGMWYADILLAIGAVLVNLPIREEKLIRVAA